MSVETAEVRAYLLGLQDRIVASIEAEDGQPFITDACSASRAASWRAKAARDCSKAAR